MSHAVPSFSNYRGHTMKAAQYAYQNTSAVASDRDRLVFEHLPQVYYIARRLHERLPQHVALEDLVSAGIVGLLDALHKYDASKNVQLSSYAKFRIQGAILDSLREQDWSPRALRRKGRMVEAAHAKLSGALSRVPTEEELAQELDMPLGEFQNLLGDLSGLELGALADASNSGSDDEAAVVPAPETEQPFEACLRGETRELLAQCIDELPERERQVLTLYYYEELTLKEVGAILGVVESRVSQIRSAALVRLRERMREITESKPRAAAAGR